ncbi:integrase core domain-containing protein, partial [Xanthomonas campestris]
QPRALSVITGMAGGGRSGGAGLLRRGKPTDNALVESFNGHLRQECLNTRWFLSLADAQSKIEQWRRFYNQERSHSALAWKTPEELARKYGSQANSQAPNQAEISTS